MALPSGDYTLPPKDMVFSTLLRGLKTFSDDLQVGVTDSSAFGYGWAQMPSAARIAAPQLLQPKPPNLALTLRTSHPHPIQTARETPSFTPLLHARRPRSAGARRSFQKLPKAEMCQTPRQRPQVDAAPEGQPRRRGSFASREASFNQARPMRTLPPAKSCRQRSQKKISPRSLEDTEEALLPEKKKMASTAPFRPRSFEALGRKEVRELMLRGSTWLAQGV